VQSYSAASGQGTRPPAAGFGDANLAVERVGWSTNAYCLFFSRSLCDRLREVGTSTYYVGS
jgi:hypothetical protein